MSGRHLAFPFRIAPDGRTATPASLDEHIKGEIIQLLLTAPGERLFLPAFGGAPPEIRAFLGALAPLLQGERTLAVMPFGVVIR